MQKVAMNRIIALSITSFVFLMTASPVAAQSIPSFPACPNPGGQLIASYDDGVHGIPGDAGVYTGADQVFKINDSQVVQCLCQDNGEGIQTIWWKDPGLTSAEVSVIQKQGWIRIPTGSLWGLDDAQYFAKNSAFSCGGGNGGSSDDNDDDDDDDDTGRSNGSSSRRSSGSSSGRGGQVLGATTLAATGNWQGIIAAFAVSSLAFVMARKLRKQLK